MSQENVEIVRRLFDATNLRDFTEAMNLYDEGVVLVVDASVLPTSAGKFCGRDAVGSWFADWFRSFGADYRFDIEEARAVGERVLVVARHYGRGRASGVALDWSVAYACSVSSGRIVRIEMYADRAEAVKAVGLEE
jgi:ketosteroid isomerase-like protein